MREHFLDMRNSKIHWPNHQQNGGTGITRASYGSCKRYNEIAATVKAYGNPKIWMSADNTELHSTLSDLSEFWALDRKMHGGT